MNLGSYTNSVAKAGKVNQPFWETLKYIGTNLKKQRGNNKKLKF